MPANLLLLPLLGGYCFIHVCVFTRFRARRLDGYRLLVESALVGLVLTLLAWLMGMVFAHRLPVFTWYVRALLPNIPYIGTAIFSLALGAALPFLGNLTLSRFKRFDIDAVHAAAIEKHGNELLKLLHKAMREEALLAITLDNRKVYIGAPIAAPDLQPHETSFSLIPFFSGYRDPKTLDLRLTVPYLKVVDEQELKLEGFQVIIQMADVRSASLFNPEVYGKFLVQADEPRRSAARPRSKQRATANTERDVAPKGKRPT